METATEGILLHPMKGNLFNQRSYPTLSEEIAHPTVYDHLSQLSVDIQLSGLIKCREDLGVQMQLTPVIFSSLGRVSLESTVLMLLTHVIFCSLDRSASWVYYLRPSQKSQLIQLPNQHGTIWAVTSTAQWAGCFWDCRWLLCWQSMWRKTRMMLSCNVKVITGNI